MVKCIFCSNDLSQAHSPRNDQQLDIESKAFDKAYPKLSGVRTCYDCATTLVSDNVSMLQVVKQFTKRVKILELEGKIHEYKMKRKMQPVIVLKRIAKKL